TAPRGRGGVRGVQRQLDVRGGGAGHLADDLAGDRARVLEVAAFDGGDPLSADEVVVPAVEGDDAAVRAGLRVHHGGSPRRMVRCGGPTERAVVMPLTLDPRGW